jgi:ATP-binding cassette subfamily C (CFTR/MRP) protein 1
VLLGGASICSTANFVNVIVRVPLRHSVTGLLPYALEPIGLTTSAFLTFFNHQRTRRPSTILLLFWPVYTITILLWFHVVVLQDFSCLLLVLILRCIVISLGLISFALECLPPEQAGDAENPILTSSVFSVWSFGYMTPLMKKGALRYITEDDLPPLLPANGSAELGNDLQNALKKQYVILSPCRSGRH